MRYGLAFLARVGLLIALIGGTMHPASAQVEGSGAVHDQRDAVHSLAPDDCCVDAVGKASAHDGSCTHVCPGGAALLPCRIELAAPRPGTMSPEAGGGAGARLARPDPPPPKPSTDPL